jgi:hypothetical protein
LYRGQEEGWERNGTSNLKGHGMGQGDGERRGSKSHKANRSLIPLVKGRVVYFRVDSLCPRFVMKNGAIID